MIGAPKGSWKFSLDFYFEPWSNLYGFMDNNSRTSTKSIIEMNQHVMSVIPPNQEDILQLPLKVADYTGAIGDKYVHQGGLLDFLGFPVGFSDLDTRLDDPASQNEGLIVQGETKFNANDYLTYIDIVRNYYVNNQEPNALYTTGLSALGASGDNYLSSISLETLDNIFTGIRLIKTGVDITSLNQWPTYNNIGLSFATNNFVQDFIGFGRFTLGGLFLRTYKMDLNRGLLNSNVGEYKSILADNADGGTDVHTAIFKTRLQYLIDKIDITGGRFTSWMKTRWGIAPDKSVDRPIYLGSVSTIVNQRDIIAQASGSSGNTSLSNPDSVLGQQVGFGVGTVNGKNRIRFKSREYGTLMCIMSMVPYVRYSQGIELRNLKTSFADIYDPELSNIGWQSVSRKELSAYPELSNYSISANNNDIFVDSNESVGKRVAWAEYMADLDRSHGLFSQGESLDYWAFNRIYQGTLSTFNSDGNLEDVSVDSVLHRYGSLDTTTYVKPFDWNYLFNDISPTAQNFRAELYFDVRARRPIGKRLMPHL